MVVSQAAAKLFTNPARVAVTTRMTDRWSIDFANSLVDGEVIASVAALLVTLSPTPGTEVEDFVTETVLDGTLALVGWDGGVLTAGEVYRLQVTATLTTGTVVERLMHIEVVA